MKNYIVFEGDSGDTRKMTMQTIPTCFKEAVRIRSRLVEKYPNRVFSIYELTPQTGKHYGDDVSQIRKVEI